MADKECFPIRIITPDRELSGCGKRHRTHFEENTGAFLHEVKKIRVSIGSSIPTKESCISLDVPRSRSQGRAECQSFIWDSLSGCTGRRKERELGEGRQLIMGALCSK